VAASSRTRYPTIRISLGNLCDANGPIWLGYPHARIATLTHDNWRLYTEKDGITVGGGSGPRKVNNEIWAVWRPGLARSRAGRLEPLPDSQPLGGVTGLTTDQKRRRLAQYGWSVRCISRNRNSEHSMMPPADAFLSDVSISWMACPHRTRTSPHAQSCWQSDDGRIWFEANNSFASIDSNRTHQKHAASHGDHTFHYRRRTGGRNSNASLATFPNVHKCRD